MHLLLFRIKPKTKINLAHSSERTRLKPVLPPFFIIPLRILPYQALPCPDILTIAESVAAYCSFSAKLKEVFIIRLSCASHLPAALCWYLLITTYSCHSLYIFECIVAERKVFVNVIHLFHLNFSLLQYKYLICTSKPLLLIYHQFRHSFIQSANR